MKISNTGFRSSVEAAAGSPLEARPSSAWLTRSAALVAVIVALGLALRLAYYLLNPGLSSDEAALALNLMHRSYSGLFGQLNVNQAAPGGFLVLQKLAIEALGPSPYALRLLPFLASVASLILFYPVARRVVSKPVAVLALTLFAISDPLLIYAATNKQYSVDVAVVLGLYVIVLALPASIGAREAFVLMLSGAIAVWLSHTAAFVLAAIGTVLLIEAARTRRSAQLAWISSTIVVWLGSFAAAYFVTSESVTHLQRSLAGSQRTLLGDSAQPGLLQQYGGIARFLLGVPTLGHGIRTGITSAGLALSLVGFVSLCRGRPRVLVLFLMPGGIALIGAALDRYALFPRTFLFLVPAFAILAAQGTLYLVARNRGPVPVLGIVAFALLLVSGSYAVTDRLGSIRQGDPARVLRYLTQNTRKGDSLYVHQSAQLDFRYYIECGCFGTSEVIQKARLLWPVKATTDDDGPFIRSAPPDLIAGDSIGTVPSDYRANLAPLRGRPRVWVLVMNSTSDPQRAIAKYLLRIGRRKEAFPRSTPRTTDPLATASVALYDLR